MKLCKSVLVAEDNDDIREAIVDVLQSEGFDVHSAHDGKEALEVLKGMPVPSLILLDLMMPEMNGWEFLDVQQNEKQFRGHKVVTISSVSSTQSLEDPTPLPIDGAILKPLALESILSQVNKFCLGKDPVLASM